MTSADEPNKLLQQIADWNANRLDLFAITTAEDSSEFQGVMRFFYQADDGKYQTKCLKVSSLWTVDDLMPQLLEKFQTSITASDCEKFGLYENTPNGERRLSANEQPLLVQLNWGKKDREGKFILRREDSVNLKENQKKLTSSLAGSIKRRWSLRGGSHKAAPEPGNATTRSVRLFSNKGASNSMKHSKSATLGPLLEPSTAQSHNTATLPANLTTISQSPAVAVPDSSFTRTIHNPEEILMKKRREKLQTKLQHISKREKLGGTLRVYGESLNGNVPYKTLLLSCEDTSVYVLKEVLEKYGLEEEDASGYCLTISRLAASVKIASDGVWKESVLEERVLGEHDSPLLEYNKVIASGYNAVLQVEHKLKLMRRFSEPRDAAAAPTQQQQPRSAGGGLRVHHGKAPTSQSQQPASPHSQHNNNNHTSTKEHSLISGRNTMRPGPIPTVPRILFQPSVSCPYLVELNPNGSVKELPATFKLPLSPTNETIIGSSPQCHVVLQQPTVAPLHCSLRRKPAPSGRTNSHGTGLGPVFCRPLDGAHPIWVDSRPINSTRHWVLLPSNSILRLGGRAVFRFFDPATVESSSVPRVSSPVSQATRELPTSALSTPRDEYSHSSTGSSHHYAVPANVMPCSQEYPKSPPAPPPPGGSVTKAGGRPPPPSYYEVTAAKQSNRYHFPGGSPTIQAPPPPRYAYPSGGQLKRSSTHSTSPPPLPPKSVTGNATLLSPTASVSSASFPTTTSTVSSPGTTRKFPSSTLVRLVGGDTETLRSFGYVDQLPVHISYREDMEGALLDSLLMCCEQFQLENVRFPLTPAYGCYLVLRACLRECDMVQMPFVERDCRLSRLLEQMCERINKSVHLHRSQPRWSAFWFANASELLQLVKRDRHLNCSNTEHHAHHHNGQHDSSDGACTNIASPVGIWCKSGLSRLADAVQWAFHCLLNVFSEMITAHAENDFFLVGQTMIDSGEMRVIACLTECMEVLRSSHVNSALAIQLFSQLFHTLNACLFNSLLASSSPKVISRAQGWGVLQRLQRVKQWAQQQGLELAADCYLQRIEQACHLLSAVKDSVEDLYNCCMDLVRLNSLQLRTLLERYTPQDDEVPIPREWIDFVVSGATQVADKILEDEGVALTLEECEELDLPLLLPEDGYLCDVPLVGIPQGLMDCLKPLQDGGVLVMHFNESASPSHEHRWNLYLRPVLMPPLGSSNNTMTPAYGSMLPFMSMDLAAALSQENTPSDLTSPTSSGVMESEHVGSDSLLSEGGTKGKSTHFPFTNIDKKDDVEEIGDNSTATPWQSTLLKRINGSLGISIVAAKLKSESRVGIYIKSVIPGGAAEHCGNVGVGDQVLEVNGYSLIGVEQSVAARLLSSTHADPSLLPGVAENELKDYVYLKLVKWSDQTWCRFVSPLEEEEEEEDMSEQDRMTTEDVSSRKEQSFPLPPPPPLIPDVTVTNDMPQTTTRVPRLNLSKSLDYEGETSREEGDVEFEDELMSSATTPQLMKRGALRGPEEEFEEHEDMMDDVASSHRPPLSARSQPNMGGHDRERDANWQQRQRDKCYEWLSLYTNLPAPPPMPLKNLSYIQAFQSTGNLQHRSSLTQDNYVTHTTTISALLGLKPSKPAFTQFHLSSTIHNADQQQQEEEQNRPLIRSRTDPALWQPPTAPANNNNNNNPPNKSANSTNINRSARDWIHKCQRNALAKDSQPSQLRSQSVSSVAVLQDSLEGDVRSNEGGGRPRGGSGTAILQAEMERLLTIEEREGSLSTPERTLLDRLKVELQFQRKLGNSLEKTKFRSQKDDNGMSKEAPSNSSSTTYRQQALRRSSSLSNKTPHTQFTGCEPGPHSQQSSFASTSNEQTMDGEKLSFQDKVRLFATNATATRSNQGVA